MLRFAAWLAVFAVLIWIGIRSWGFFEDRASDDLGLTHVVQKGDLIITISEQGTLESSNNTEIKSRIRGGSTVTSVIKGGTNVRPGDLLVQLDTKRIEDAIGKNSTDAFVAKATFERTKADLARAELAIEAYLEGTYKSELKRLEQNLALAKSNLKTVQESFLNTETFYLKGYVNKYELQSAQLSVEQATLVLKVRQKEIDVLNDYTKVMELEILNGNLKSLRSKFKADEAGLRLDESRRDKAIEELDYCEVRASRDGLVIYPSSAEWKETPDVTEGGFVRHDQVMLLMPDLTQMQVKVGIHEAQVDRVKKGMIAKVALPDFTIDGKVESIASVAKPAGWWTGNMVKYETVISLPETPGLRPGMSAQVDIVLAEFKDQVLLPVSAIVEVGNRKMCWVKSPNGQAIRTIVDVGESNDVFMIAKSGVRVGDEVVLNPLRFVDGARQEALRTFEEEDSSSNRLKQTSNSSNINDHLVQGALDAK
ncbi:MAG: HlyD family efflux transporter periplasmic adaptor subunit [Planctomycetota bacterium]